jgi:hypothetical protein
MPDGKILSHKLKMLGKLKALKWKLFKYGKIEDRQAQEVDMVHLFILEYRYAVLLRGMQH